MLLGEILGKDCDPRRLRLIDLTCLWGAAAVPVLPPPSRVQSSVMPALLVLQPLPSQINEMVKKTLKKAPSHL